MSVREKVLIPAFALLLVFALFGSIAMQLLVAIPANIYIGLWRLSLRLSPSQVAK